MNSTKGKSIYTRQMLCPELKSSDLCFKSMRYRSGEWTETLHKHIPSRRISQDSALEALRRIAARSAEWPEVFILHSQLNDRRGGPERYPGFTHNVSYPEEGVVRHTASAGDAWASYDRVVNSEEFRRS